MKKIFILSLLIIFALSFTSFADAATKARVASVAQGISQVDGIADLSSGDSLEIDSDGSASVKEYPKTVAFEAGDAAAKVTGACTVYGFIVTGVSAGDNVQIYDALTATGTPKFDIVVGTAADTKVVSLPAGGVSFSTGVSYDATDDETLTTIIYSQ